MRFRQVDDLFVQLLTVIALSTLEGSTPLPLESPQETLAQDRLSEHLQVSTIQEFASSRRLLTNIIEYQHHWVPTSLNSNNKHSLDYKTNSAIKRHQTAREYVFRKICRVNRDFLVGAVPF